MTVNAALRDYFLTRRSVGMAFLQEPGPNAEELRMILTIGTRVPDHGKLTPWRLILIAGDDRVKAGERLAEIARAKNPAIEDVQLDLERRQFLPAPLTIGVVSTAKPHPKIPEFEQLLSAGNVAFNIVNGAYALGFAAQWVTRWYAYDEAAARMLGAREGERFVGFVHIGTPTATMEDRPRPALEEVVSSWRA
jgi:nitroreductase